MDPFPLPKWPCSCFHSQSSTWLLLMSRIIHWQPLCSRSQSRRGRKLTCVSCLVYSWPQAARGGAWRSGTTCLEHTWRRSTCMWSRAAVARCCGPAPTPKATSGAKASALLSARSPTRSALSAVLCLGFWVRLSVVSVFWVGLSAVAEQKFCALVSWAVGGVGRENKHSFL